MQYSIARLLRPVDNSPLVVFRMIFGLLICLEAWGAIATGWVKKAFITPLYTFPFIDFSWLQPLPGDGMYYYYMIMGAAGVLIMLGLFYRPAILLYTIMWGGVYFMQKSNYNNHYYLLLLFLGIMCLVPAHKYASLDVKRNPSLGKLTCPQWCIWIFVVQIAIVYFYGSIAKMYPGWVELKPMGLWFRSKRDYFLVGPLLQKEWFQYFVAYGGIAFDLLIVPGLLWKKTRKFAFGLSIFFHLFNSAIFQVGIFPYMGISWALFFFPPETVRRIFLKKKPPLNTDIIESEGTNHNNLSNRVMLCALGVYVVIQALLPLRHHWFNGNVFWTEEGHRMSWRMMLRVKYGSVKFTVVDKASRQKWIVNPRDYVTAKQANAIACKPDMCWQFVQILKADYSEKGFDEIEVYALSSNVSLNGDPYKRLYDPKVDLARVEWQPFQHSEWLMER